MLVVAGTLRRQVEIASKHFFIELLSTSLNRVDSCLVFIVRSVLKSSSSFFAPMYFLPTMYYCYFARCGQLLGHATAKGLPWVRAWACSLVVWAGPTTTTCSDNDASSSSSSAGGGGRMVPFRDSVTRLHGCVGAVL